MSFDLFVFEKREEIKTSLDVFAYQEEFTEYKENKDYESLDGCSDVISCWAKKMFEKKSNKEPQDIKNYLFRKGYLSETIRIAQEESIEENNG